MLGIGKSRDDARAVKQVLIEYNELGKNGGSLLNKINSIPTTPGLCKLSFQRGRDIAIGRISGIQVMVTWLALTRQILF